MQAAQIAGQTHLHYRTCHAVNRSIIINFNHDMQNIVTKTF
jgi:hypothetical protein